MTPARALFILACTMPLLAACDNSPAPTPPTEPAIVAPTPAAQRPARPASEDARAPMLGAWSADLSTCDSTAITITETRLEGMENACDITALSDNQDGSFTASLACTGEGQSTTERLRMVPLFAPTGEGIGLTWLDRGGEKATVLRCSRPTGN